jgi:flagellar hook protein FlgE
MSSFSTALSGLLSNTTALDVVGDNIANLNTQGFKASAVGFQDALTEANGSLQIGAGVGRVTTTRNYTQGSIQTTHGPLDAAIQGNGFFVVQDPSGSPLYTRDGRFSFDSSGTLVTSSGDLVQGWMAVNGVLNASGPTNAITVPSLASQPPAATTKMTMTTNLNAAAKVGDSFASPIQVVDSLGNAHTVTATFTQTGPNAWSYDVTIPGGDLSGGTAGTATSIASGNLTFDVDGKLTTPAVGSPVTVQTTGGLADGAADLNIQWNLYAPDKTPLITQFAQPSATFGTSQDGIQPATVTGVSLQDGGGLVASYSNGNQVAIAQLALASVTNPDSLIAVANNKYMAGTGTVTPSVGVAGTGNRGHIVGGAIEASNVDMATEFTNLIVYQRGYQANSKVVTTINQMDQTLLAINP